MGVFRIVGKTGAAAVRAGVQCATRASEAFIRLLGLILSSAAEFLFVFVTYVYFRDLFGRVLEDYGTPTGLLLTGFGMWCLGNLHFNHIMAVTTSPGLPPGKQATPPPRNARTCRRCNDHKPERSHHCSICGRCVMKMDHHCPWINNCVGFRNQRFFFLFLFYLSLVSIFILMILPEVSMEALRTRKHPQRVMMAVVLLIAAFAAATMFLLWNVVLLVKNESTLEYFDNRFAQIRNKNTPYDLGFVNNVRQVFGEDVSLWNWFLPRITVPMSCDGTSYPLNPLYVQEIRERRQREVALAA